MPSKKTTLYEGIEEAGTIIIADTANFNEITRFNASEGTTNPSLLYQAAKSPEYHALIQRTIEYTRNLSASHSAAEKLSQSVEYLAVQFGVEIYKLTGRISTEVDVTHSFDTTATVVAALRIINLYAQHEVPKEAVRIKISATWEGIQAARILESEHGVSVLITIVFGLQQAITAAEAGVTCIAPYVGRIGDWYKANGDEHLQSSDDMGVARVKEMQNYIRNHGYKTKVMAASFRNVEQVIALAGIDYLTVAPAILNEMKQGKGHIKPQLTSETAENLTSPLPVSYIDNESAFRWALNTDACAVEKSADAMRRFAADTENLKTLIASLM